jgi:hypothetical protein
MTFVDHAIETPRGRPAVLEGLRVLSLRRLTEASIAHLDNRLREDVGLPPVTSHPLLPHEAAARIAMLAWR